MQYNALDRERLDALCFTWASELVVLPTDLPAPAPGALDLGVTGANDWLQDYAERSNWSAIEEEAADQLSPGWLERQPWPVIFGCAPIADRMKSPVWALTAFAAPAGFASDTPFGVVLHNTSSGALATHAIVCDPTEGLIVEAWERRHDHAWLERRYPGVMRTTVEHLRNPMALPSPDKVVEHKRVAEAGEPLRSLAPLLAATPAGLG
jgi:hypothetical protein